MNELQLTENREEKTDTGFEFDLTPSQIVTELDHHIIGQKNAKKAVAIALRNRTRRRKLEPSIREEIYPKNILMIGPTGVGKTEIARRLAKLCRAPFLKVEATKYTEVGYVGRDVESMIRDLMSVSLNLVKAEFRKKVEEDARKKAEDLVLDILIPPPPAPSGTGYQTDFVSAEEEERKKSYQSTREIFRSRLRSGKFDSQEIEVELSAPNPGNMPSMQVFGAGNLEEMDSQLQNFLGDLMNRKNRKKKLPVQDALKLLAEQEAEKLLDPDKVNQEAVRRAEEAGIIFIDEIDKVAGKESRSGADVSREGVQRDLLPIVEGASVNTKAGPVRTDYILFIAAGAFHISKPSDLIPELQGRFPIRVELEKLSRNDFIKILTDTKSSLTKQYQALLSVEGVELDFSKDGIEELASTAFEVNESQENIGARRLNTILEKVLEDLSFEASDLKPEEKKITVTKEYVQKKIGKIVEDKDLSRYIL